MDRTILDEVLEARRAGRGVVLVTDLESGEQSVVRPLEVGDDGGDAELFALAHSALLRDASGVHEIGGRRLLLTTYNPPLRMVVVGAVHIAQPLAAMAARAGFAVTVVDPRRAFASEARFPDVALVRAWPEEAFADLGLDHRTAVVTLTHDPKLDDPALAEALRSDVFYVGALGSRRTHERRRDRLAGRGFDAPELDRIRGPVGLDIGARTPAEIAVAILAEVIAVLRGAGPAEEAAP